MTQESNVVFVAIGVGDADAGVDVIAVADDEYEAWRAAVEDAWKRIREGGSEVVEEVKRKLEGGEELDVLNHVNDRAYDVRVAPKRTGEEL